MKKKIIILLLIVFLIGITIIMGIFIYKNIKENREQARYDEIRASVKEAVEWEISAVYPYCSIASGFKETSGPSSGHNSSHLINQGYIKKKELLDVDNTSYCDVYVKINPDYEDPYDHQKNCKIYYKIYLKCKNHKDKGYINWGY